MGLMAQPAPEQDENIPYLVTFGADSEKSLEAGYTYYIAKPTERNQLLSTLARYL
jgi:hypothetical protein